jgi:hypothetical protein
MYLEQHQAHAPDLKAYEVDRRDCEPVRDELEADKDRQVGLQRQRQQEGQRHLNAEQRQEGQNRARV